MRVSLLTYAFVSIGLLQASANPLRVLILDSVPPTHPNTNVATIEPPPVSWVTTHAPEAPPANRQTCRTRFRQKAIAISNAFRQALGLPPIQVEETNHVGGSVKILPFIGTPHAPTFIKVGNGKNDGDMNLEELMRTSGLPPPNGGGMQHSPHPHRFRCRGGLKGFMMRLHRSLNALGPWEGKAVAFVLGCGIGVLIRMFWVLALISYRSIRGDREAENTQEEYSIVLDQSDAEVIFVAPPSYADADEKPALT